MSDNEKYGMKGWEAIPAAEGYSSCGRYISNPLDPNLARVLGWEPCRADDPRGQWHRSEPSESTEMESK